MANEADTCRRYVVPKLQAAGWHNEPHRLNEQVAFTDGRIVVIGNRTRRERVQRLRGERKDFFDQYGPEARSILDELLDKYTEHGTAQFVIPDALELPPINKHGNVMEIAAHFGGEDRLAHAVSGLQMLL